MVFVYQILELILILLDGIFPAEVLSWNNQRLLERSSV